MKRIVALVFIFTLTASFILNTGVVIANPSLLTIFPGGTVPPDNSTKAPIIIIGIEQNKNFSYGIISIPVKVTVGESNSASFTQIKEVYYKGDWQINDTSVYKFTPTTWNMSGGWPNNYTTPQPSIAELSTNLNLSEVPEGKHMLTIYAMEDGQYNVRKESPTSINGYVMIGYNFKINSSASINFIVDTISPSIQLSIQNSTYYTNELPLTLKADEPLSQFSYSLDNQANVTLPGNTTLTGLTYGSHNIAVYTTDSAGNIDRQIITFNIAQPLPAIPITLAFLAICGGLLTIFTIKRQGHSSNKEGTLKRP